MGILLLIPALIISLLWYMPGIRLQGENAVIKKKDYLWCITKAGLLTSCLLIVLTEIFWDFIIKHTGFSGLPLDIFESFFRAALLEEALKFLGCIMCIDRIKPKRKIDFVMLFGLIGLVYNVFEKLFMGGAGSIVGAILPMHMMWQFNQGAHYYENKKAVLDGDSKKAEKEKIGFLLVPFVFHGTWDAILSVGGFLMEDQFPAVVQILGFALIIALIAFGGKYSVKTFRMVKGLAIENESLAENTEAVSEKTDSPVNQ